MSKKIAPPAELETLEGGPAVAVAEMAAPAAGPKMEMATMPGGAIKLPEPVAVAAPEGTPGIFAPAPVATLPPIEKKHFYKVWPHMQPRPAGPSAPGVLLNPDNTVYQPRQREGGQFSVLRLEFGNMWTPDAPPREAVLPLCTEEGDYGKREGEIIRSRTEVIFDFQDQMLACLKAFGKKPDPLADNMVRNLRAQGFMGPVQQYDAPLKYGG